jgi:hypothetical protein
MQVSLELPRVSRQRSSLAAQTPGNGFFASLSEDATSAVQLPVEAWEVPATPSSKATFYLFRGTAEVVSFVGSVTLNTTSLALRATFTEGVTLGGVQIGTIAGSMMLIPATPEPVAAAAAVKHAGQTDDDAQRQQQQTAHEALLSRLLNLTSAMNAATARTPSAHPTVHVQAAATAATAASELEEGEVQAVATARQQAVKTATAAAHEQQEAGDVRIAVAGFSFEPRCGAVNWRRVAACNSGRIQRDGDLHAVSACTCLQLVCSLHS